MNLRLWFLPLLFVSFIFISATTVSVDPTPVKVPVSAELRDAGTQVKKDRVNFFQRLIAKLVQKKSGKVEDTTKADELAARSQTFGIIAISTLFAGLFIPFVILATIPTGIIAMSKGNAALKSGTKETGKAHTGKTLGIASLIAFGALLVIGLILAVAFLSAWR